MISANNAGVLHTLDTIRSNDGGVLKSMSTIQSNDGGVLRTIHSEASFPDNLTWVYPRATGSATPITSNSGFSIKNTRTTAIYGSARSNTFAVKGRWLVTLELYYSASGMDGGSGGVTVYNADTGNAVGGTSGSAGNATVEIGTGSYYIEGGATGGNQSGTFALEYEINISRAKA